MPGQDLEGKYFAEKQVRRICLRGMAFDPQISRKASLDLVGPDGICHLGSWLGGKNLAGDLDRWGHWLEASRGTAPDLEAAVTPELDIA